MVQRTIQHMANPKKREATHLGLGSGPSADRVQVPHDLGEDPVDVVLPVHIVTRLLALETQSQSGVLVLDGKVLIVG